MIAHVRLSFARLAYAVRLEQLITHPHPHVSRKSRNYGTRVLEAQFHDMEGGKKASTSTRSNSNCGMTKQSKTWPTLTHGKYANQQLKAEFARDELVQPARKAICSSKQAAKSTSVPQNRLPDFALAPRKGCNVLSCRLE